MNLHKPLTLDDATTDNVDLVPTKAFFKPVLVVSAPLGMEEAAQLGCAYLFDGAGNPVQFEGTHKLVGELSGAEIELKGQTVGPITIKTEKVARLACFRQEKEGMRLRLRAHLPEDEGKLIEMLHFLATLNKEPFQVTVRDRQRSLVEVLTRADDKPGDDGLFAFPQPDSAGLYPLAVAVKRPFLQGKLEINLYTLQVGEEEFIGGWAYCWKNKAAGGEMLKTDSIRYSTAAESLKEAAGSAWHEIRSKVKPTGVKEISIVEAGLQFLQEYAPELMRELDEEKRATGKQVVQ